MEMFEAGMVCSSTSFDEVLVFNKGPLFNMEPAIDPALATSAAFSDEPVFDVELVIDEEPIFDEGPLFDEDPNDMAMVGHNASVWLSAALQQAFSTSTTDKELVLDSGLAAMVLTTIAAVPSSINIDVSPTCSTKCPNRVVNITAPMMVNAIAEDVVVAPDHTPAPSTPRKTFTKYADGIVSDKPDVTLDMESCEAVGTFLHRGGMSDDISPPAEASEVAPPKVAVDMELLTPPPAKCSTKCPNLLLVNFKAPLCAEGTTLNFYPEKLLGGVAVLWEQTMKWTKRQPWPPPMQFKSTQHIVGIRPMPWPSFNIVDKINAWWYSGLLMKPPWLSCVPVEILGDRALERELNTSKS